MCYPILDLVNWIYHFSVLPSVSLYNLRLEYWEMLLISTSPVPMIANSIATWIDEK